MRYLLYALTLLLSSSLLFFVQPMVAKMVTPVLGGSPAVWNTCMVFFQAMLLGGYVYAHASTRWLGTRRQSLVHLAVMIAGVLFLPIGFEPPTDAASLENPALWLLGALFLGVGWPFFVISTSAPLLQKWFSTTDHPDAADPYHLYAASNVGSFFGLVAYPFLIEPRIGVQAQTTLWMICYLVLIAAVAGCAVALWRSAEPAAAASEASPPAAVLPLSWGRRARWVLWAFIPSSMMLAVTSFVTTDIAPVPMLWIPPLAIYLLSFVLVFARVGWFRSLGVFTLFPLTLLGLGAMLFVQLGNPLEWVAGAHFLGLLIISLVFHGLLAADRPATRHLTEFFCWMSVGGALGGVFNALLAPLIFDRLLDYPALLVMAALAFPGALYGRRPVQITLLLGAALAGYLVGRDVMIYLGLERSREIATLGAVALSLGIPTVIAFTRARVLTPVLLSVPLLISTVYLGQPEGNELHAERSFFAANQVLTTPDGGYHKLYNGTTLHGVQAQDDEFRQVPLSYYYLTGPLGQLFEVLSKRPERHPFAVVGLGTGAIAAYTHRGQEADFFEIDQAIARIARDPRYFSYLEDCLGECRVILGDGRLQLAQMPEERYELIVLDAYSSTAIPVHLLTREAIEMYLDKLTPDGILAFHISNRHLDLQPPLTRIAGELGLVVRGRDQWVDADDPVYNLYVDGSDWLMMARNEEAFGALIDHPSWHEYKPEPNLRVWTDDYANIFDAYIMDF
ncbi:hypothetical protein DV096_04875 [Bradymonadaceae bacterium TMQ3]|uniref:Spermidine synthase n=1 Tax=Lujinxingia sediminis TaxID=2480984 RepID=A0ABY0CW17_9DELT|nr:fused MFS/spermidine synthase [Lujinxingia sediminis]RDV39898.1 hypothetical protein DV096_04875 [Bradymonadaceae bacterium TMQ3]RVU48056.1 hypothetical protein EA187_01060 [Lujinxingia sediminis]TXC77355.1 hypothetical protein FRC91_01065 [Bradymonadales bacterium TMQ1]